MPRTSAELALREAAQKWGLKSVAVAGQILEDDNVQPSTRLQAAELLLNRGFGRPAQPLSNPDLTPLDWNGMDTGMLLNALHRIESTINGTIETSDAEVTDIAGPIQH